MILKKLCPICKKESKEPPKVTVITDSLTQLTFGCGHFDYNVPLAIKDYKLVSQAGEMPFKYQIAGAKFIADANGRALIADEMGLGKTIQFLIFVHEHYKDFGGKVLVIVKSGLRIQWLKETMHWLGDDWMFQILESDLDFALPTKGYIISMDMLRRFKDPEGFIKRFNIKCIGIDEVQAIKNHDSQRTNAVRKLTKHVDYVIALSGTPIKNHPGEYFPILNILHPERFPSLQAFYQRELVTYYDGYKQKFGGLQDPEAFRAKTKDFIIRRTRDDVNDEIALACGNKPFRQFRFSDLGKEVELLYEQTMKQFEDFLSGEAVSMSAFERSSNILAYLSKMRHLAGLAKIDPCVEFVEDFIMETERKLVIFVHHKDVMEVLRRKLDKIRGEWPAEWGQKILTLSSEMDSQTRAAVVEDFRSDKCRILIASTLAAGEGLNLQFCSDCVMMERQWNPANEEQAEGRFIRIGQTASRVNATYLVAVATVDEFFSELVEQKRTLVTHTLDGIESPWEETTIMRQLTEIIMSKRGKKWSW